MFGKSKYHKNINWLQMEITLPKLTINQNDSGDCLEEQAEDVHVELTKNYVVFLRRNGQILKTKREQFRLKGEQKSNSFDVKAEKINLPIAEFVEDKNKVDEVGLKWMFVDDLVQIKLKHCLI